MLVGRDAELAILDKAIAAGQPMLILVTSEPKMGKSSLLWELRLRAESRHYRVIPEVAASEASQKVLSIDKETTEERFCQAMSMTPTTDSLDRVALKEEVSKPTLILIDGYRPQKQFEDWFTGKFIPMLKETRPPKIVIVAAYSSDV